MQIEFERRGGFAGICYHAIIDTGQLSTQEASEITGLVHQANFFDLPEQMPAHADQVDRYQYRLTVDDGQRAHTVEVSESSIPPSLQPLLDHLTHAARPRGASA